MTLFQEFLVLAAIICGLSACTSTSVERMGDAMAVSATTSATYSEEGMSESSTINFSYDNYNIDATESKKIRKLATLIKNNSLNVRIEGHCDERGTREYNLALGEKRANAVAEILIINGVSQSKISTVSYGEEKPSANGSNDKSWSINRRAVIKTF
jgi:peptidoglycan-associated lipoprotein